MNEDGLLVNWRADPERPTCPAPLPTDPRSAEVWDYIGKFYQPRREGSK